MRAHPELFAEAAALRLGLPGRSAAQIASILYHRHGIRVHERTIRAQLRRAGLHREALAAEPKTYGRYEATRPNQRWISDVLIGPWVPWPRQQGSVRARLFLIVDDHSRLLIDGRFFAHENARACQDLLRRAITRRGLPEVFAFGTYTRLTGRGFQVRALWCTRTASAILAGELSAISPSIPAVLRPVLRCVTCRTLTSVFDQDRSIIFCKDLTLARSSSCAALKILRRSRPTLSSCRRQLMASHSKATSSVPFTVMGA